MFRKLIGFETLLQTRQVGFWIACLAMFSISGLIFSLDSFSVSIMTGEKVKANGSVTLAIQTGIFSLGTIFFGAVFVVNGVMRDETSKMLEIIHATPVSTTVMTATRIFGAFLATYLCVFACSLGLFAGQFAPWLDKETIGPINVINFLYPALIFSFVNALFVTAFFTLIAGLTRNRAMVYVSAVGLFLVYFMVGIVVGEDPPDWIGALSDPFGVNALAIETEFWSSDEQNNRALPIWGWIALNRLLWSGVALGMLLTVFAKFKRGLVSRKVKPSKSQKALDTAPIALLPIKPRLGFQADMTSFVHRLKYEYNTTVKSIAFIILVGLAVSFFAIALISALYISPEKVRPTSSSMIKIAFGSLALPMSIIVIFFAGEIIWRDRVAGIHEVLDSTPARNWPFLAAKWFALILIVLTILTIGMVFTMIVQFFVSDVSVNISTYLKFTYLNMAPNILALTVLALFVQNFLPNRVLGMLVSAGVIAFVSFFIGNLPFYHPLMGFGAASPGSLSEMAGYKDLLWFKWLNIYWGSLCVLMAVFSLWIWRRGLQTDLVSRLKSIRTNIASRTALLATLFAATFIGSGAYIFKATNIDNTYYTKKESEKRTVAREKLFATEVKFNVPKIQSVVVDIDFKPSERSARVKGHFVLKNVHAEPIVELYVNPPTRHAEDVYKLEIDGAERVRSGKNAEGDRIEDIEDYHYYLYRFDPPLAPGAVSKITFDTFSHEPRLYDPSRITRNGTFENNEAILPEMGIRDFRMRNPDKRRKYGLDALEDSADRDDLEARKNNLLSNDGDYVDFKSKMCTDPGQIAISPGKLLREYTENGRACRDYEAINPILNFFSFVSADYTVKKDVWKNPNGRDVEIVIYYHKTHHYNVDLMIDATKHAFDVYTKLYGPYRYHQMRILEIPYIGFAQAFAGTVPFSEGGFILDPGVADKTESIDKATSVTLHEVAHQWFGHQIVPADTKGASVLSEGLAENATTTAYEALYGWQKTRFMVEKSSMETYLVSRGFSSRKEASLAEAGEQSYLAYNKSDWVFWGLKHYMGEEAMQGAIKKFVTEHGSKGPPYPTTLELVAYLREAAGPEYQGLITDYWDRITFWKLSFGQDDIKVVANEKGGFSVTLPLIVDKLLADEKTGKEKSVLDIDDETLDEWVEIGFYTQDPKETLAKETLSKETVGDEWMSLERVRVTQGETSLTFDMVEKPTHVLLDPRRLLIERNVKDNVKTLK